MALLDKAQQEFSQHFEGYLAMYTIKKDYWGEYVLIEPGNNDLLLRYDKDGFRVARKGFWGSVNWSIVVYDEEDIGEQLRHFKKGLRVHSGGGVLGEYP